MPFATSSRYSPSGTFQTYRPVVKSMALSVPQGGATAGYPSGSRNLPYSTRYFWSIGDLTPRPPLPSGERGRGGEISPERMELWIADNASEPSRANPGNLPLPS